MLLGSDGGLPVVWRHRTTGEVCWSALSAGVLAPSQGQGQQDILR